MGHPALARLHFEDHGPEVGTSTLAEYVRKAREFFERARRDGLPTKIDEDGTIRIYERRTNTFGSYTPDGFPKTFMKPPNAIRYWNQQPGVGRRGP